MKYNQFKKEIIKGIRRFSGDEENDVDEELARTLFKSYQSSMYNLMTELIPQGDESDWEFFMSPRFISKNFSFLDNYNERVKSFVINLILTRQEPGISFNDFSMIEELSETLTEISDLFDIIEIFRKNDFLKSNDSKKYSDKELRQIMLDDCINLTKKRSENKMKLLLDGNFDLIELKFIFQNKTLVIHVHSFTLDEEYFINALEKFDQTKSLTFYLDSTDSEELIVDEIKKYLYTGSIELNNLNSNIAQILYIFGNQYQLELENIMIRYLELDTPLRGFHDNISDIFNPKKLNVQIDGFNCPIYISKFKENYLLMIEHNGNFYYVCVLIIYGGILKLSNLICYLRSHLISHLNTINSLSSPEYSLSKYLNKHNIIFDRNLGNLIGFKDIYTMENIENGNIVVYREK